ncbi:abortive infection system toxin AbiGii family protein [Clostridium uliginosum]|uniref:Putative abortive phage resistance protein AbiGii toxin n=1 Tax=Clostridium uliginosum TaxID=119641 RepID=A0A1I1J1I7_9CLOT|nr:abortive infection system toxin AbiGii family protein [Clostridium uliginosum]SFC41882.1 Putative abortive phage resistance protein AbiGii toxin [Clostridium uliginosum]
MFANFKKAFKQEEETMYKIPEIILENLNDKLSDRFEYIQVGNDMCTIMSKEKEVEIKAKLKLKNMEGIKNTGEAIEYLYRTQQEVEIAGKSIELDGVKFDINELIKMPLRNKNFNDLNGKLILKPHPFPKPFKLMVGYGDKNIEMLFQRQPYADLHKILFKSIDRKSLVISYIVDEVIGNMIINVSIHIGEAESVEEIVEISRIYKCFMSGEGRIADINLNRGFDNITEKDGLDSLIEFWNKVDLISKELGILFNPKRDILKKDVNLVERLYRCFVKDKPYKEIVDLENLTVKCSTELDKKQFINKDGLVLEIVDPKTYELLEEKFDIYTVTTWCNVMVKDAELVDKKNWEYKFIMDTDSDKKIFRVIKYFKNKEDAEKYREGFSRNVTDLENVELI